MTWRTKPRLKVAPQTVQRLKGAIREEFRRGRGRALLATIAALTPKLRGWGNYFKLAEVKGVFEVLDEWLRRKLRCLLWRQWKHTYARAKNLMRRDCPKNGPGVRPPTGAARGGTPGLRP